MILNDIFKLLNAITDLEKELNEDDLLLVKFKLLKPQLIDIVKPISENIQQQESQELINTILSTKVNFQPIMYLNKSDFKNLNLSISDYQTFKTIMKQKQKCIV